MSGVIGIRKEDKNRWERRVPLIPEHIRELISKHRIEFVVEPSEIRAFPEQDYLKAGAKVQPDLSRSSVVLAIKEIPPKLFESGKTYIFFSHTIKGQKHNMPILKKLINLKCQLIDYEKIVNERGVRLIFFGRYAGLAGIVETFWALGQRLNWEGISNPFANVRHAYEYENLEAAKKAITEIGVKIKKAGLSKELVPFVIGIAGYGNVAQGVQEILALLPITEITPEKIESVYENPSRKTVYKVVFKEEHMAEPKDSSMRFELQDYYKNPEKYQSKFERYLPHLSLLMNCIYWDARYPRLVTKDYLRRTFGQGRTCLRVIGDISCDIEGSVECTVKATEPDNPVFVYNPHTNIATDGCEGDGVVVMAVDNLPCEFPRESSENFSNALRTFIPDIVNADFSVDFEHCQLPPQIKNAVIVYHGELTPNYRYLEKYL